MASVANNKHKNNDKKLKKARKKFLQIIQEAKEGILNEHKDKFDSLNDFETTINNQSNTQIKSK